MASFESEPALCSRVYPEPWAWFHTFTSQEFWCSSWKTVKFHALYDFFHNLLQLLLPPACVWSVSENYWSSAWWKVPVPPLQSPSLFLRVSGSWIMKHDLRRLPGDHRWGGKADNQRPTVQCEQMQSVHSAACLSAPMHQGWCQVKTMDWDLLDWMLLHANRCEYRHINIHKGTHGRFALNTIAHFCHADLAHCKEKLFPRSWGSQRVLETRMMTHLIACGNKNDLLPLNHLLWKW